MTWSLVSLWCVRVLGVWTELAAEFRTILNDCPSSMAKRWLVLRVCISYVFVHRDLYTVHCHTAYLLCAEVCWLGLRTCKVVISFGMSFLLSLALFACWKYASKADTSLKLFLCFVSKRSMGLKHLIVNLADRSYHSHTMKSVQTVRVLLYGFISRTAWLCNKVAVGHKWNAKGSEYLL